MQATAIDKSTISAYGFSWTATDVTGDSHARGLERDPRDLQRRLHEYACSCILIIDWSNTTPSSILGQYNFRKETPTKFDGRVKRGLAIGLHTWVNRKVPGWNFCWSFSNTATYEVYIWWSCEIVPSLRDALGNVSVIDLLSWLLNGMS